MRVFQRIEVVILLILLVLNLGFIVYLVGSGVMGVTGLVVGDQEVVMPYDFVKEDQIKFEEDKLIIELEDFVLSRYEDTGSMSPTLGKGATGVGFKPTFEEEVHVGDIVSFWQDDILVVHRVVDIGADSQGIYFITRGDNNNVDDGKIRFKEIDSVLVAIIY